MSRLPPASNPPPTAARAPAFGLNPVRLPTATTNIAPAPRQAPPPVNAPVAGSNQSSVVPPNTNPSPVAWIPVQPKSQQGPVQAGLSKTSAAAATAAAAPVPLPVLDVIPASPISIAPAPAPQPVLNGVPPAPRHVPTPWVPATPTGPLSGPVLPVLARPVPAPIVPVAAPTPIVPVAAPAPIVPVAAPAPGTIALAAGPDEGIPPVAGLRGQWKKVTAGGLALDALNANAEVSNIESGPGFETWRSLPNDAQYVNCTGGVNHDMLAKSGNNILTGGNKGIFQVRFVTTPATSPGGTATSDRAVRAQVKYSYLVSNSGIRSAPGSSIATNVTFVNFMLPECRIPLSSKGVTGSKLNFDTSKTWWAALIGIRIAVRTADQKSKIWKFELWHWEETGDRLPWGDQTPFPTPVVVPQPPARPVVPVNNNNNNNGAVPFRNNPVVPNTVPTPNNPVYETDPNQSGNAYAYDDQTRLAAPNTYAYDDQTRPVAEAAYAYDDHARLAVDKTYAYDDQARLASDKPYIYDDQARLATDH